MSLLATIEQNVNLPIVLRIIGILLFGLALFMGWHEIRFVVKLLLVFGVLAFVIGLKYKTVYSPTPGAYGLNQTSSNIKAGFGQKGD